MGFCELLTLIFVILKVSNIVNWAWWIVFIPMYPALLFYLFMSTLFIIGFFGTILKK